MDAELIEYSDFEKVKIAVGKIISVEDFPEARKPAYKLEIDFGDEIGIKKSSAQITDLYTKEDLKDRLILAVINFSPRQIGPFMSEVLTLGVPCKSYCQTEQDASNVVALISPDSDVELGSIVF